jgi:acetylornithine deacetylase/succinyl-diaminopimelate desuccinylase-like protein
MMKRFLILLLVIPASLFAQMPKVARDARTWRQQHERPILGEFTALLSVPNVTRDRTNVRHNAEMLVAMMQRRGIAARLVTIEGANPVVFGELVTPGAKRTIAFYAHYDGQPVDETEWATPPFVPTLRSDSLEHGGQIIPLPPPGTPLGAEARMYARGSGDDKSSIMAMLAAVDALRATGTKLHSNIKFAFDGEEEAGSPNLQAILAANRELFAADLWIICDGPVHQSRRPLIYFGARDVVKLDVTVYGARNELHSGHYGNWSPNPALMLARLLTSMKDEHDRVVVEHFYADIVPLSATERQAIADAPDIDAELMRELWLGATESSPKKLAELITEPSLNIRGMSSGHTGAQASNVVPSSATAAIDIRLVKGMDPRLTQDRVIEHIRRQGYFVVENAPDAEIRRTHPKVAWVERGHPGLGAVRTPMDLPIAQEVVKIVESVRGPAVKLPNMGGSLPLAEIEQPLGTHTIVVPIANHDDNQHTFNENLRIQNLWDGIEVMAALMSM